MYIHIYLSIRFPRFPYLPDNETETPRPEIDLVDSKTFFRTLQFPNNRVKTPWFLCTNKEFVEKVGPANYFQNSYHYMPPDFVESVETWEKLALPTFPHLLYGSGGTNWPCSHPWMRVESWAHENP